MDDQELRTTFNEYPESYYTYRPKYPEELFDKLVAETHIKPGAQLLEIGPGTGQATVPLAKRGYSITAVELGPKMADKARAVLKDYRNVEILVGAFEDVPLPKSHFDLIYSARAFHWIRPESKFKKPFELLRPNGHLAVIQASHVSDESGDKLFFASRPIYREYACSSSPVNRDDNYRLPRACDLKPLDIDTSLFDLQSFTTIPLVITYTGTEYAGLLSTFSKAIALPAERRKRFLEAIKDLVNMEFNGAIEYHFAVTLTTAMKKA
ncbi:MAG TPA: methyltransferase domain-containing protein [Methanotrichaceae archaeon]|nr:methyltransferase domain-containing protein [Methanotrichaceae archaeon]